MTVAIGVLTVAVVLGGVATVTVAIGVLTVTVAATVTGEVGMRSVGRETVGTRSFSGNGDRASTSVVDETDVDERTAAGGAPPPELCVDTGASLTAAPRPVLTRRGAERLASAAPGVRLAPTAGLPKRIAAAAVPALPTGATTRAATIPVVARPAAATTAAPPFTTAACGRPAFLTQRHNPTPPVVTPSV